MAGYVDARTRRHGATPRRTTRRTARSATRLADRARAQRQWSVQGVDRAKRDTGERDKFIRQFKVATSEKQAAKAKATERAIARLDPVEKPWEGWDLRFQLASAPRSGDVVVRLRGAVVERGTFRLGPVDLEIAWGERVAIVGPERVGEDDAAPRPARATPARRPGNAGWDRVSWSARWNRAATRSRSDASLLDAFVAATGLLVPEARSLLAKFGLGAEHVLRPGSTLSPGERTRAVLGPLRRPGRELPGARRAHQPSRPAGHRAARTGARELRRHPARGDPRPAAVGVGAGDALGVGVDRRGVVPVSSTPGSTTISTRSL